MKLVPLGDKIVLKQLEAEETTKSGIVLPGQAKEKPQEAEVIAVGPGGNIDGKEVVSSRAFLICATRSSIAFLSPQPSTITVFSFCTFTDFARPS